MHVTNAPAGARIYDSLPFSSAGNATQAAALRASGSDAVALYLGAASPACAAACLAAGLGVFGVTFGGDYDGNAAVAHARALGFPPGTSLFLDVEGPGTLAMGAAALSTKINAWADIVAHAGYLPGMYVGAPQPLTSAELYSLRVVRYWRGQGRMADRNNALAEPACGWCMVQAYPSRTIAGVLVDCNQVSEDYHGRTPAVAYA